MFRVWGTWPGLTSARKPSWNTKGPPVPGKMWVSSKKFPEHLRVKPESLQTHIIEHIVAGRSQCDTQTSSSETLDFVIQFIPVEMLAMRCPKDSDTYRLRGSCDFKKKCQSQWRTNRKRRFLKSDMRWGPVAIVKHFHWACPSWQEGLPTHTL